MARMRPCLVLIIVLASASCSSPTTPSQTVIVPAPALVCPAPPPAVTASSGQSVAVAYGVPTVSGGSAPISTVCAPPSGSLFATGATTVTCTATDAIRRTATCAFTVSVLPATPRLAVTTILAFGDSITEGEVPVAGQFSLLPQFVEKTSAYPAILTTLLAQRYTGQGASRVDAFTVGAGDTNDDCNVDPPAPITSGIVVINAGCLGEPAENATTVARLNDKITFYHPDVVLLLEGVNDLSAANPASSIAAGVQGVRTLIATAQSRNVRVMVGTLLPQISADLSHGGTPDLIVPFNAQLVPVAVSAGVRVVDLYSDILTNVTAWISPFDGLHPTEAGYQEIARVWFTALQSAFEVPQSARPTASVVLHRASR
jgi:lysophospholipase L1-like esterase